jgi:hypothetical protein
MTVQIRAMRGARLHADKGKIHVTCQWVLIQFLSCDQELDEEGELQLTVDN